MSTPSEHMALAKACQDTPELRAGINERRFFENMKHLFASSFSMLGELMQNARRAGATQVAFELDAEQRTLMVHDDGCGIEDFQNVIALCDSGWNEQIQLTDKPFGMGLFSLFFAAEKVVFRSKGHRLEVSLGDITNRRTLKLTPDRTTTLAKGTRVELHGLHQDLLAHHFGGGPRLLAELKERSMGFPIPVIFNGGALPRPHAQSQLEGIFTPVGFVSYVGVTHQRDRDIAYTRQCNLYLQGLPIGAKYGEGAQIVVHLDSVQFTARMPDRSDLFDPQTQWGIIQSELRATVTRYLAQAKHEMEAQAFIKRYWKACRDHGCSHLLNDIPWVPERALARIDEIKPDGREMRTSLRTDDNGQLIHKCDIESGRVRVWIDIPEDYTDDYQSIVAFKVMQRLQVLDLRDELHADHWLFGVGEHFPDLDFTYEVDNPQGSVDFWMDMGRCTIHLADKVTVKVRSRTKPDLAMDAVFDSGWIMVTDDPEQEYDHGDVHLHCFDMPGPAPDEPVDALSDFTDEHDNYRDEWREEALKNWRQTLCAMRGATLSELVESCLYELSHLGDKQVDGMCVVIAASADNASEAQKAPVAHLIDLDGPDFWRLLARNLELESPERDKAELTRSLRSAFLSVAKQSIGQLPASSGS